MAAGKWVKEATGVARFISALVCAGVGLLEITVAVFGFTPRDLAGATAFGFVGLCAVVAGACSVPATGKHDDG